MAKTTVSVPVKFRTPSFSLTPNGYVPAVAAPASTRSWSVMLLVFGIVLSVAGIAAVILLAIMLATGPSEDGQKKIAEIVAQTGTDIQRVQAGSTSQILTGIGEVKGAVQLADSHAQASATATRATVELARKDVVAQLKRIGAAVRVGNAYARDTNANSYNMLDQGRQALDLMKKGTTVEVEILKRSGTGLVR